MFCPKCKYEYVEGVTECPDCNVELVGELPKEEKPKYRFAELVTVFVPEDSSQLVIAKTMLEDAGIHYFAKNEQLQNLFGVGQFGIGYNALTGPVEIQVRKEDAEPAIELLQQIVDEKDQITE